MRHIDSIVESFCEQFEAYAKTQEVEYYDLHKKYKDKKRKKIKEVVGQLCYKDIRIEFVYLRHGGSFILAPKSSLECRIWFLRREERLYYSLYDLMEWLNEGDFICYFYPYIESAERMKDCFQALANGVSKYCNAIQDIARKDEIIETIYKKKKEEIIRCGYKLMKLKKEKESGYVIEVREHFSSMAYLEYLEGHYKKAIKIYGQMSYLLNYEKRLVEFMNKNLDEEKNYQAIIKKCNSLKGGWDYRYGLNDSTVWCAVLSSLILIGSCSRFEWVLDDVSYMILWLSASVLLSSFAYLIVICKVFYRLFKKSLYIKNKNYGEIIENGWTNGVKLLIAIIICVMFYFGIAYWIIW